VKNDYKTVHVPFTLIIIARGGCQLCPREAVCRRHRTLTLHKFSRDAGSGTVRSGIFSAFAPAMALVNSSPHGKKNASL
jgi:hypothetical protein